jgi:hypothetical protein
MKNIQNLALALAMGACTPEEEALPRRAPLPTENTTEGPKEPAETLPADHCEYVERHADEFRVQLTEVIRGVSSAPLESGASAQIIFGPQGGYHVGLDIFTSCWYDPTLLREHLDEIGLDFIDPRVQGVSLTVQMNMEDQNGDTMYEASLNAGVREAGDQADDFPMYMRENLWIISPDYLATEGVDGRPQAEYPDVTIRISATEYLCDEPLAETVFTGVNLSYIPAQ